MLSILPQIRPRTIDADEPAPSSLTPDSIEPGDDTLVLRYLRGDETAFDQLYERHKGAVYRFCLRQLPEHAANDVFQDIWAKLITNLHKYEARGSFTGYLFTLAHSTLMDHFRKHRPFNEVEETELASSPLTEEVSEQQIRQKLYEQIEQLPLNQRTVWLIKQETGMSLAEIAKVTGTTVEGVRSRLRYANDKLKAGMQRYVRS